MSVLGRLTGWLTDSTRGAALPTKSARPYFCPRCGTTDICGERPCRAGVAWPPTPSGARDADWHCHRCRWAVRW